MSPKSSEAAVGESKVGEKMNVKEDVEAAQPALPDAPDALVRKIRMYIALAAVTLLVLWICTSLLYHVIPCAVCDPCEWEGVRRVLWLARIFMESIVNNLPLMQAACYFL